MKKLFFGISIIAVLLSACNSTNNQKGDAEVHESHSDTNMSTHIHESDTTASSNVNSAAAFNIKEILAGYLQVKNSLAKDNGKDAANAGMTIVSTLAEVDIRNLTQEQTRSYTDIADDLREHAEHISSNGSKIAHQREHFIMMSNDIADLVKTFGNGGQTLYKDFCPMANDGKGAIWISELKEIKNPYLGSKMPDCGTVKETIK